MSIDELPGGETPPSTEPMEWWGYRPVPEHTLSLVTLVANQTLTARVAAFLWLAMEQRPTVIVAAREPQAGKTTLLTALLDCVPPEITRYYLRGWYERFEFAETADPTRTYLLCNEISSHLPIYLWGRGVRRAFALLRQGHALATTVHAASAEEVRALFTRYPLEVPETDLAAIDLIISLGLGWDTQGLLRRVMRVETFTCRDGTLEPTVLAHRATLRSPLQSDPAALVDFLASRFSLDPTLVRRALARRERLLSRWVATGPYDRAAVRQAFAVEREAFAQTLRPDVDNETGRSRIEGELSGT